MKEKTLYAISLSAWLEHVDICDFPDWIDNLDGIDSFLSILMLEKNCHQLSDNALEKLLIYAASSQENDNVKVRAIDDKLNKLMNSTIMYEGVSSFFKNESMHLL